MTIRKDEPWGHPGPLASHGVIVASNSELRAVVEAARRAGEPIPEVGLLGGDLCRTVGGRGDRSRLSSSEAIRLSIDVAQVAIDDETHWFVAHLVARRGWWIGRVVAIMNAQWIGRWDVAPRSHPNDGLLDVFDGDPTLDDRWKARSRLLTGTHVPHPEIRQSRVGTIEVDLGRRVDVHLDGDRVSRGQHLQITVEPDALTCVV
jgi:diacylglycerol kinase family enzyme